LFVRSASAVEVMKRILAFCPGVNGFELTRACGVAQNFFVAGPRAWPLGWFGGAPPGGTVAITMGDVLGPAYLWAIPAAQHRPTSGTGTLVARRVVEVFLDSERIDGSLTRVGAESGLRTECELFMRIAVELGFGRCGEVWGQCMSGRHPERRSGVSTRKTMAALTEAGLTATSLRVAFAQLVAHAGDDEVASALARELDR
jgi:hypothetical protein